MDVLGLRDDGYHEVATVMQQISLSDDIEMDWQEDDQLKQLKIDLRTNKSYLPTDERNLAYKAAVLMEKYALRSGKARFGCLKIRITKRIPVAAGLAGGSGNGAAVIIGLNRLWELGLTTKELCEIGAELGSDVPFMVLTQNSRYSCAMGRGRGEVLTPISRDLDMSFLLVKPRFGVSTKEVYQGIDQAGELDHPDGEGLMKALLNGSKEQALEKLGNVLETYTLKAYPEVAELKKLVADTEGAKFAMMSGSGPTVIGFYDNMSDAKKAAAHFKEMGYDSFFAGNMRRIRGKH
ncbi:MAG: 4-(cytidine 5'-diphospho)-2-C-methyl-D-erythritol kinase [Clostridiales bacterium]|nr:4-(cytidine 5'-diphospho)-2-C-methyl-D-erythritol kinase [Clostridiales bacterium]